jgi:hypothetical protein
MSFQTSHLPLFYLNLFKLDHLTKHAGICRCQTFALLQVKDRLISVLQISCAGGWAGYPQFIEKPLTTLPIDFEKGRTVHGISDLSYYGLFRPSLLQ